LNPAEIENRRPGFQEAFHGFDPEAAATLSPDQVDALTGDTRIVRNRRRSIHNPQRGHVDLEREFGGFKTTCRNTHSGQLPDMRKRSSVGDSVPTTSSMSWANQPLSITNSSKAEGESQLPLSLPSC
jgi:DNA-3-methyladenine glycosylase I